MQSFGENVKKNFATISVTEFFQIVCGLKD